MNSDLERVIEPSGKKKADSIVRRPLLGAKVWNRM